MTGWFALSIFPLALLINPPNCARAGVTVKARRKRMRRLMLNLCDFMIYFCFGKG